MDESNMINNDLLHNQVLELESKYLAAKEEANGLKKQLTQERSDRKDFESEFLTIERELIVSEENLKKELNSKNGEQSALRATITHLQNRKSMLKNELFKEREKSKMYFEENAKLSQKLDRVESEMKDMERELNRLHDLNGGLKSRLRSFDYEVQKLEKNASAYEDDLVLKEVQVNQLLNQLLNASEALEEEKSKSRALEELDDEYDSMSLNPSPLKVSTGIKSRKDRRGVSFGISGDATPIAAPVDGHRNHHPSVASLHDELNQVDRQRYEEVYEENNSLKQVLVSALIELKTALGVNGYITGDVCEQVLVAVEMIKIKMTTIKSDDDDKNKDFEEHVSRIQKAIEAQSEVLKKFEAFLPRDNNVPNDDNHHVQETNSNGHDDLKPNKPSFVKRLVSFKSKSKH